MSLDHEVREKQAGTGKGENLNDPPANASANAAPFFRPETNISPHFFSNFDVNDTPFSPRCLFRYDRPSWAWS
jgi:hypothetical protein